MTAPLTEEIGVGLVEFLKGLRDEYANAGRPLEAMGFSGAAKSVQKLLDERCELREALKRVALAHCEEIGGDADCFHDVPDCPANDTCTCVVRALLAVGEEERT